MTPEQRVAPSVEPSSPLATPTPKVTVILLTADGGPLLAEVLAAITAQQVPWPFELLILDSCSSDGSLEHLPAADAHRLSIRLVRLPRAAFQHGRTRNLGAALARGQYLVFLVQDATPVGTRWLLSLVEALVENPTVVGAYARQLPRADADTLLQERIAAWTPPGDAIQLRRLLPDEGWNGLSPQQRVARAAFDNVCSIVPRAHLLEWPFPELPFGEDLCWGAEQLQAGHTLAYLPTAQVVHSHQRSFQEHFRRARLEHAMLISHFGLRTVPGLADLMRGLLALIRPVSVLDGALRQRLIAELLGQYLADKAWPLQREM